MAPTNKRKKQKVDPNGKKNLVQLSKNLMQMKFMQRSRKEYEKQVDEKEGPIEFNPSEGNEKSQIIQDPSYVLCEKLRFGRFSFKGMNVDVEQLMVSLNTSVKRPASESSASDEDDNEIGSGIEDGEVDF